MASPQEKDNVKNTVNTTNVDAEDVAIGSQVQVNDSWTYLRSSKWNIFYRSVLCQMILFGALSFVGPAMSDAISNLGGGGLSKPWLANLSNSLNYGFSCLVTLLGGPLINKIGIKWSCMIAAVVFPLGGSAYYLNARDGVEWYLLFANIIGGITSGFLYVGETTAMLSYPKPEDRGFYLGIWSAMRNSGSVVGGAINFSTNYKKSSAGGIAWSTMYRICVGIFALSDQASAPSRWQQNPNVQDDFMEGRTYLVFIPAFYSFFYGGTMGTYLSLHFSVRARALSSLIVPTITIPLVIAFGKLLDCKWWPQRRRAWVAFLMWCLPQIGCFIWLGIEYNTISLSAQLDYELQTGPWIKAYLPYLVIFVTGYWTQLTLYWVLGTFSTDVKASSRTGGLFRSFETAGQAVSYGLSSASNINPRVPFYVNCAVLVLVIPCMIFLIRIVPEISTSSDDVDGPVLDAAIEEKRDV
ncbi:hypothetical protein LTR08_001618 [Meristemomyces frigidus]|nr:hypothetical protein LTR08_001618 [Meristemomyces frigidus]